MPLYPFACAACSHEFEVLRPTTPAADTLTCPACDGRDVTRRFAQPARPKSVDSAPATNCRGDGPPCGAFGCGRAMP